MWQFITGIDAFEVIGAVNVISAVNQPVSVKNNNGIDAEFTAATTDFFVPIDGGLATAVVLPGSSDRYIDGTCVIFAVNANLPIFISLPVILQAVALLTARANPSHILMYAPRD